MGLNSSKSHDSSLSSSNLDLDRGSQQALTSSGPSVQHSPTLNSQGTTDRGRDDVNGNGNFCRKDLNFLIGNLEKLPASARRLFGMGKMYLTTGKSTNSDGETFVSLFEKLPQQNNEPNENVSETGQAAAVGTSSLSEYENCLFVPIKKSAPLYHAQTYVQWKAASDLTDFYTMCKPKRRTIYLQPIGDFPDFILGYRLKTNQLHLDLFEVLQGFVQIYFSGLEVDVNSPVSSEGSEWSTSSRYHDVTGQKQYCVNDIYPYLQNIRPADGLCIAGITWTDIYPEGYNFVLGEASVKHKAAVISFGRFETKTFESTSHEDITAVDGKVMWKLLKSLSHELCHLMGLEHCTFFLCAMNESSSVADALTQPLFLCPVCLRKLQTACGFDVLERYQLLKQFLDKIIEQQENTSKFEESSKWLARCIDYLNS